MLPLLHSKIHFGCAVWYTDVGGQSLLVFYQHAFLIFLRVLRISISKRFISFTTLAKDGTTSVAALLNELCDALSAGGTRIPNHLNGSEIGAADSICFSVGAQSPFPSVCFPVGCPLVGSNVETEKVSCETCSSGSEPDVSSALALTFLLGSD